MEISKRKTRLEFNFESFFLIEIESNFVKKFSLKSNFLDFNFYFFFLLLLKIKC